MLTLANIFGMKYLCEISSSQAVAKAGYLDGDN